MKRFLFIILLVILVTGCGGDSNEDVPQCAAATGINAVQNADEINFTVTGTGGLYYEVSLVQVSAGNNNPEGGTIIALASGNETIKASDIYVTGQVLLYVRSVCDNNLRGAWVGPKPFTISNFCATPTDLNVNFNGFTWRYFSYNNIESSTYQVEYGPQGFALGTGTRATVNDEYYSNFTTLANTGYDFYVRAYCVNNVGYGNWAGPFNYFSEGNINACQAPVNISYTSTYVSNTSRNTQFIWNANGESRFEYTIVDRNVNVDTGTVRSATTYQAAYYLNPYNHYDFYVRAVCSNGNKTAWVKKEVDF